MAAYPLRIIHIVGIVAKWLVQVTRNVLHAVRIPERDITANRPTTLYKARVDH